MSKKLNNILKENIQRGISLAVDDIGDVQDIDVQKVGKVKSISVGKEMIKHYYDLLHNRELISDDFSHLVYWYNATGIKYKLYKNDPLSVKDIILYIYNITHNKNFGKIDLNWIDVSKITDFSEMFYCWSHKFEDFDFDVSEWDVSNATNMHAMFKDCEKFNCDLNKWDVSNVEDMSNIFYNCLAFNGNISTWNVSKVINAEGMFSVCGFNGDISKWNVSSIQNMKDMFKISVFDGDISKWDVSHVHNMKGMFYYCNFNGDISKWNTKWVEDMSYMFYMSKFTGDISKWNTKKVYYAKYMFELCEIPTKNKPVFKNLL